MDIRLDMRDSHGQAYVKVIDFPSLARPAPSACLSFVGTLDVPTKGSGNRAPILGNEDYGSECEKISLEIESLEGPSVARAKAIKKC